MRIAHIRGYFQPQLGYEDYYLTINQIKMGNRVLVITSERYFPFDSYDSIYKDLIGERLSPKIGFAIECGIPTVRLPVIKEIGTSIFLKNLKKIIKKFSPDIIHIHEFILPLTIQIMLSKPTNTTKIILDEHMIPFLNKYELSYYFKYFYLVYFFRILNLLFIRPHSRYIYATKDVVAEYLNKRFHYGIPVIPLGVDAIKFNSAKYDSKDLKKNLGFDEKDFILFYSGKIIKNKGIENLIEIFLDLSEKHSVGLLLIGSGNKKYIKKIKNLVKNKQENKFKIIPFVHHEELPQLMSIGNLGCWIGNIPSSSIIEFLSMGKIVITKVFEGINLEHRGFKFIKQYRDYEDSKNWVENFIIDKIYYEEQCFQARKFILENLDWQIITKKVLMLYQNAINS